MQSLLNGADASRCSCSITAELWQREDVAAAMKVAGRLRHVSGCPPAARRLRLWLICDQHGPTSATAVSSRPHLKLVTRQTPSSLPAISFIVNPSLLAKELSQICDLSSLEFMIRSWIHDQVLRSKPGSSNTPFTSDWLYLLVKQVGGVGGLGWRS